jgi:hypothetical protein
MTRSAIVAMRMALGAPERVPRELPARMLGAVRLGLLLAACKQEPIALADAAWATGLTVGMAAKLLDAVGRRRTKLNGRVHYY